MAANFGLKPNGAITKGRFVKRVTAGGEQKCDIATDKTRVTSEIIVGAAVDNCEASAETKCSIKGPGQMALMETGGAIAVGDYYLTTDGSGRVVNGPTLGTDMVLALNVLGQTASAAGGEIEVLLVHVP